MAVSEANAKVDDRDGWRYCSVCRKNHEEGRKHIFTKKHLSQLKILMGKFLKKAEAARQCVSCPVVLAGELEPGAKVWCHCCGLEVPKHVTDGNTSVEWGGLIDHMSKPDHHKNTRRYWWEVGAETRHLATLLLFPAEYDRYKVGVASALEELERKDKERVKKLAEEVRIVEEQQAVTALEPPISFQKSHSKTRNQTNSTLQVAHCSKHPPPVATDARISGRGNVHTGATPPWLRNDDEDQDGGPTFGPSEEEFIKHRERLRHAGKNPRRVGADFHLQLALQRHRGIKEDENWLPSFGRVWNEGPRSHTQSEFREEMSSNKRPKLQPTPPITVNETLSSSSRVPRSVLITPHAHTPSQPAHTLQLDDISGHVIKPYTRKRKINKTSTFES